MTGRNQQIEKKQKLIALGLIAGVGLLLLGGLFFFDQRALDHAPRPRAVAIAVPGSIEDRDAWRAQSAVVQQETVTQVDEVRNRVREQSEENKKLAQQLAELKQIIDRKAFVKPDPAPVPIQVPLPKDSDALSAALEGSGANSLNVPIHQPPLPPRSPLRALEMITFDSVSLESEGLNDSGMLKVSAKRQVKPTPGVVNWIPAGSFVRVMMLNGVDAPTGGQAQSNPLPVAFHVVETANLANRAQLDIRDCRFISAAWGDLSSERMMARTESLTCIVNDQTIEIPVKGIVIGEDGKAGVRGRLVTKQGQLLANALLSGALSGIGQTIQQSSMLTSVGSGGGVSQIIDPKKATQAALGGGLSGAANSLSQYYLKAADKLFPVIETDGGRTVEILITQGATTNGEAPLKPQLKQPAHPEHFSF